MTDQPHERRNDNLTNFRMDRVERELEKTNDVLIGLDGKLDTLRGDLFERSIFVNINTMELALQQRDAEIKILKENIKMINVQKGNDKSAFYVKVGLGIALLGSIASSVIGIIAILIRA